jgi:glucose-1-phosphate cytidylyltransferase
MKVVILAGGLGTRLREETEYRPKPMVEIGGRPILWHIMKNFSAFGLTDFIVPVGYRAEVVKDYFLNYEARMTDFTVELGHQRSVRYHGLHDEHTWRVTVADTGLETPTGGRVKAVERYVDGELCIVTYGDGLADVDVRALLEFHRSHGRLATVTTVRPLSRFGVVDVGDDSGVRQFREKPVLQDYVSAGFFVFEPEVLAQYLTPGAVLEQEPVERLAKDGELAAFRHDGFWQPMDTYREYLLLNELWNSGRPPWKRWT